MSYGINFTTDIFLSRISINSIYELDEKIRDVEYSLSSIKEQLMMYASVSPKDVIPDDWKPDGLSFIHQLIESLIEQYDQDFKLLIDLNYYKETNPFVDKSRQ